MRWDGTVTIATLISAFTLAVVLFGGIKFWLKIMVILGEYPPHRHDDDGGITYPQGMAPDRHRPGKRVQI